MEQAKIQAIQSVADAINRLADAVMAMSVAAPGEAPAEAGAAAPARRRTEVPVALSDALAAFIGVPAQTAMTRQEASAEVMKYVKAHDLQVTGDRRKIQPDGALGALIGSHDTLNVLNLKSALRNHFAAV